MKRLGLTLSAITIFIGASFFLGRQFQAESSGTLTIVLVAEEEISRQQVSYQEGDTLYDILTAHYTVYCANAQYLPDETCEILFYTRFSGRILLGIDDLMSNWTDTYIQIQINGVKAEEGMDQLKFTDKDIISLVLMPSYRRD
jgi:hypothetical protein